MVKRILSGLIIYFAIMSGATGNLSRTLYMESTKDAFCEYLYMVYVKDKNDNAEYDVYSTEEK